MNWDRVERLIGSDNLQRLHDKRVAIIGLGSGGGFVALSLAMSGVGKFVLVDDDTLESKNIVRHVADSRYVGRPKAEVVAELIRQRNPHADVEVLVGRLEQHLEVLERVDLVISGVDGEGPKYTLNQACLQHGLTAVYAGVYERGEGGDVVVIRPYNGPCYACWAAELREGLAVSNVDGEAELDYGMIGPEGTLEAEPGLWLHVTRIASAQADIALNELLMGSSAYKEMPANTVIMANTSMEILAGQISQPYTAVWVDIERDPNCLVCGDALRNELSAETQPELSLDDLMHSTGITLEENAEEQE
ncbi:MAG: ThiF family adenylyltransferase [Anaerolineae bacterium]|nr:ThiF family adenylyltransferase [Anaerolineae bacterium]MBN8620463.1 ThiF family adenylyltransferase [Anaerolineae bacterium]